MPAATPSPSPNPVFKSDDFVVGTSSGLDETTANSLYLRKTLDDTTDHS